MVINIYLQDGHCRIFLDDDKLPVIGNYITRAIEFLLKGQVQ